ncbi:DUF5723 family protein [Hymenobacter sp. GOD-10R]|uniref:DUF5723 family protein n=1 Tax=Hymenobacter sp. GOD-10R TaxID=3093922 RepID=UPI002D772FBC|nr:DUF5723 family protein [Hymenobacter sp. GOD-10R]WRQ31691.1 DUF5723 family protein [Hymenobacter sp. GOD-10R]
MAANRYRLQIHGVSSDLHATNNAYKYIGNWTPVNRDEGFTLKAPFLKATSTNALKLFSAGMDLRGPGVLVRLSPTSAVAVGTRIRRSLQGNAISASLLTQAVTGFSTPGRWRNSSFNLNSNAFAEWDLTYGRVIIQQNQHLLKAGVTLKRMMGQGAAYLQGREVAYELTQEAYRKGGDSTLVLEHLQGSYAVANAEAQRDFDLAKAIQWLTGRGTSGQGWGADLGVVYEFDPVADPPSTSETGNQVGASYKWRVAVSLNDVGSVNYNRRAIAYDNFELNDQAVSKEDITGVYLTNFDSKLNSALPLASLNSRNHLSTGLPTAFNCDLDYAFNRHLYLNAGLSQGIKGRYSRGMRQFSYASLTPRFESKWLGVAFPFSFVNNYQQLNCGIALRIGSATIGTNNMAALFSKQDPRGFNVYSELTLLRLEGKRVAH